MFDPTTLSQLEAGYQSSLNAPPKKKGNFLTSLIPSGGGIAGAAGGAALGTAILPGVGTLAGALLGGALGGGAGKVAENAIEKNSLTSGVAGEAAINGILGAGPLRLGKLGVDAVRGVTAGAGLADALKTAGTSAANMSLTRSAGNKLAKSGEGLIAKEFRLNPTQQANFKKLTGEEAVSVLRRYGIKSPEEIQGAIRPIQDAFDSIVKKVPNVSATELQTGLEKIYRPLLNSPALFEQNLGQQLKTQADELLKTVPSRTFIASASGDVAGTIDKAAATKRISQINKLIKQSQTKGGISGKDLRSLVREKSTLETALNSGNVQTISEIPASRVNDLRKTFDAAVNYTQKGAPEYNVIKKTADALRGTLQSAAEKAGVRTADGATFKDVGLELRKLRNLDEIVGKQAYLGTGSLPLSLTQLLGSGVGAATGGLPGAAAGIIGTQLINSNVGRRIAANGLIKGGDRLVRKAAPNPYSIGKTAGRIAPIGLASALAGQSEGQSMATSAPITSTPSTATTANMPELSQPNVNMSTDPFAPENLRSSIEQILANGGKIDDVTKFVGLAETLQKLQATAASKPLTATQLQQANNAQSGLSALQTIQDIVDSDPNALLKSFTPTNVGKNLAGGAKLNTARQEAADVIARLRTGAAINKEEEKFYQSKLPQFGDTAEQVRYKLQSLATLFNRFSNPEAAQPDLTNALAGGGY